MAKRRHNLKLGACGGRCWWRLATLPADQRGAVSMEYVILAVLVAAATVVAVVTFSRSIHTMFVTASQGAALEHTKAHNELIMRRNDRDDDAGVAKKYHDSMHQ